MPRRNQDLRHDKKVYGRCGSCRFWVTRQDRHCANCGLVAPHSKGDVSSLSLFRGFLVGGALLGGIAGASGLPFETMAWAALWGGCAGAPFGWVADEFMRDRRRKTDCLQTYERTIKLRLKAIDGVLERIGAVRARLGQAPGPELQRVSEVLCSAERAYPEHRDRYRLKLFEIDLVRWQNALEPLGHALEGLTFEQCDRRLDNLAILRQRGEALAEQWEGAGMGGAAREAMRPRLERGLALCEQIRQSLITRQALNIVSGVQALETEPALAVSAGVEAGLELMAARVELGEFVQGLSALEAEHARLEAELEVNRRGRG